MERHYLNIRIISFQGAKSERCNSEVRQMNRLSLNIEDYILNNRPVICTCNMCGTDIRGKNRHYGGDRYFLFPSDESVCMDCLWDYCIQNFLQN